MAINSGPSVHKYQFASVGLGAIGIGRKDEIYT